MSRELVGLQFLQIESARSLGVTRQMSEFLEQDWLKFQRRERVWILQSLEQAGPSAEMR
jgi:hypothetical protein